MFVYHTQIRLKDTDATGVLYFSEQFSFALEALEEFLKSRGVAWSSLMESGYFLPVVHAEADYLAPLRVGDSLEVHLSVAKVGTSSVTLDYTFHDQSRKIEVGRARIVHVATCQKSRCSVPIPEFLREVFAVTNSHSCAPYPC
jgi:1,4-dihydroxy-2-naphthoyl-CoA hydrolase